MTSKRDEFRRSMAFAAARSPDDPERRVVERSILDEHDWAQEEWTQLLRENDCLRTQLAAVEVPANLEDRLLKGVDSAPRTTSGSSRRWLVSAAAVLLIALGAGFWITRDATSPSETVALLAIANHREEGAAHVGLRTADREELQRSLVDSVPFAVHVPDFNGRAQLVGGRACKLGGHKVAFSSWLDIEGTCSLYQVRPDDFGLPARTSPLFFHPKIDRDANCACIWRDDSRAYILVGAGHKQLQRVLAVTKRN